MTHAELLGERYMLIETYWVLLVGFPLEFIIQHTTVITNAVLVAVPLLFQLFTALLLSNICITLLRN